MRIPVFGIGFPRTGTVSLCEALRILGWNPVHNPRSFDQLDGHDAAADVFVVAHWKFLLRCVPHARFVLTMRDFDSWCESLARIPGFWQSKRMYDRYFRHIVYRTDSTGLPPRETLQQVWRLHCNEVYARIPRDRLLVMHQPFTWEPLCRFLGLPEPEVEFPWKNRGGCQDVQVKLAE